MEDDARFRHVLELLLSDQWDVLAVEDGRSALRTAREHPPDLAVVDLRIPQLDGLGLLRELRAHERTQALPVIMISGVTEEAPRIEALEAGANDFLVKPFSERELMVKMKAQLEIAAARAAEVEAEVRHLRRYDELLAAERAARQAAQRAEGRVGFLVEASRILASSLDYEATLASIVRLAVPALADACGVDVSEGGRIRRLAAEVADPVKAARMRALEQSHPDRPDAPAGISRAIRSGKGELLAEIPDRALRDAAQDDQHLAALRALAFRSAVVAPLGARGQTLGAVWLAAAESGRRYGPEDLALAQSLADLAALAMDNARLYREAQEASRLKDDFLATLSHELRTPLNAIVGWAHLLRTMELDREAMRRAAETIDRNARIQSRLIADMLDVSRIVTGSLRLDVKPLDLAGVLAAVLDTLRPSADAKQIRLESEIQASAGLVSGDADRLRQVFWSLLTNAVKFTERGGVVRVRLGRVDSQVEVVVEDNGIGISADFLPYIFERFRQQDGSTTRGHGGLGLGLAIARHLVELHGGTLEAASAGPGRGASLKVRLPVLSAPAADGAGTTAVEPPMPSVTGLSVLIVDDDADTREILTTVLARGGARVAAVASASEALAAIQVEPPDVLLCDIEMPGQNGYDLVRRLRALPPERGGRVAAAALTAYARAEDRLEALRAGFQFHMAKPVDPRELVAVVASLGARD